MNTKKFVNADQKTIWDIVFCVSAGVMIGVALLFAGTCFRNWRIMHYWHHVAQMKTQTQWSEQNILPQYQSLYEQNPDMVGWLNIEGAKVDYPVMQTKDNPEYYLWHEFDHQQRGTGTPFVDFRCDVLPERSFNTIIYMHDFMVRGIFDFAYKNRLYPAHKYIRFDTLEQEGLYELAAVFYVNVADARLMTVWDKDNPQAYEFYNYIEVDSVNGFEKYLSGILERRLYETSARIAPDSHIITLIACADETFSGMEAPSRIVIIAVQVDTAQAEAPA